MNPLIRWTIGNVSDLGFECLKYSIKYWNKLYGNSFEKIICYNNLNYEQLKKLENFKVYNQKNNLNDLILPANKIGWKLYPPRLNSSGHEIFIDNDLIIYKKIPLIDKFLDSSNLFFITEGLLRCFDKADSLIAKNIKLNTGFFGIPPNFDFKTKLNYFIKKAEINNWNNHFSEQGVVSCVLTNEKYYVIPLSDIFICYNEFKLGKFGTHFVGLNSNFDNYWNKFKTIKL